MSRRALLVGIDRYDGLPPLTTCAADARAMFDVLAEHADGRTNYECLLYCGEGDRPPVTRALLRRLLTDLFTDAPDELLFYFSGHGALAETGGYLCTTDGVRDDLGVPMDEVLHLAMRSAARSVVMLLDCCHAGNLANAGQFPRSVAASPLALLREELTVVAAARGTEQAWGANGHGLFTAAMLDALRGGAKDMFGAVTAPALYSYVERRFSAWDQRPVYKAHATRATVLRECAPVVDRARVRRLPEFFPAADAAVALEPAYEDRDQDGRPRAAVNADKVAIGNLFRVYRDAGLLRPTTAGEQLFWTAQLGHTVELTERGRDYWWLAANGRL